MTWSLQKDYLSLKLGSRIDSDFHLKTAAEPLTVFYFEVALN